MNPYVELFRINHWHKNITVILGIVLAVFVLKVNFTSALLANSIIVTALAILISVANYMLNAITDMNSDKKHPTKKFRPLPSKKTKPTTAFILMIIFLIFGLTAAYSLFSTQTTVYLITLFVAALFYNIKPARLKDIPYVDVLSESINNPIRLLIGWSIVSSVFPGVFILFLIWFLACFMMTKKRMEELMEFKARAVRYRKVFKYYTKKTLNAAMAIYILLSLVLIVVILYTGSL
jgi:4-hydroxybenzoate polyprenyltransferase